MSHRGAASVSPAEFERFSAWARALFLGASPMFCFPPPEVDVCSSDRKQRPDATCEGKNG